jgi:hypothetical protein
VWAAAAGLGVGVATFFVGDLLVARGRRRGRQVSLATVLEREWSSSAVMAQSVVRRMLGAMRQRTLVASAPRLRARVGDLCRQVADRRPRRLIEPSVEPVMPDEPRLEATRPPALARYWWLTGRSAASCSEHWRPRSAACCR